MATQRTWQDIVTVVSAFDRREGATPDADLYRMFGDEALVVIAEAMGLYEKTWVNSVGGELTLTSATCPLPIDLAQILAVEYDGTDNPLDKAEVSWLDDHEAGWREVTGDPDKYTIEGQNLVLNGIPTSATGKLVIRGKAYLPQFSDAVGATNPLTYLPWGHQLLPAQYIIASLPVTPAVPPFDSEAGMMWAISETKRRQQARADALARFERGLSEIRATVQRRQYREFRYD